MGDIKQTGKRLIAEIDETEVACIIMESCCRMQRPLGTSAEQAMSEIKKVDNVAHDDFQRAARRVMLYLKNQIDRGSITQ